MELGTSFRAATISNPQSTPYNYSNPIRFPISNPVSFDTAGGSRCRMGTRGWSGKLKLTFRNRLIIEAVRNEKTGSTVDHANSGDKKWVNFGLITESLSNGMFRVHLLNVVDGDDPVVTKDIVRGYLYEGKNVLIPMIMDPILGYGSGKIRTNHILILPGDVVKIEVSRYDPTKGRIIYRFDPRELRRKKKEEDENDEKSKRSNGKTKGRKQKMSRKHPIVWLRNAVKTNVGVERACICFKSCVIWLWTVNGMGLEVCTVLFYHQALREELT